MENLTVAIANTREVYRQALESCEKNIKTWEQHRKEYTELKERLEHFPRKLSQDVMVPLGKVALMPGHLIHTNEVLVLLGDNWFVTRSAHQANEIIDRRLKYVDDMIVKYEEERKLYIDRLEATARLIDENDGGDYFEIREPAPSDLDKQKKVRIAHKPGSIKKTDATVTAMATHSGSTSKKVSDQEFSDLMGRLDELQVQERVDKKQHFSNPHPSKASHVMPKKVAQAAPESSGAGRRVAWKDDETPTQSKLSDLDQAVSHSEASIIPDDKPKSILKNRSEHTPVGELPPSPYEQRPKVISAVNDEVFSGKVMERTQMEPTPAIQPPVEPLKRVSIFALERAGLKKQ